MKTRALSILLFSIWMYLHPNEAVAQKNSANFFFNGKFDSVVISVYDVHTEEMREVTNDGKSDSSYSHYLAGARLSDKEISGLYHRIISRRSYAHHRADLTHSDICISYYLSGQVVQYMMLSAISGNCLIERLHCPQRLLVRNRKGHPDMENDGRDDCLYTDKVSPYFAKYLKTILVGHDLYDKLKDDLLFQQK